MPNDTTVPAGSDQPPEPPELPEPPRWDPVEILRRRAAAASDERNRAITALRSGLDDDQIRHQFGIDLDTITPVGNPPEPALDSEPPDPGVEP